jgi:hypothetical protein
MPSALELLQAERVMLEHRLKAVSQAITALTGTKGGWSSSGNKNKPTAKPVAKRRMSAAARAKISKAAKERWAKIKGKS